MFPLFFIEYKNIVYFQGNPSYCLEGFLKFKPTDSKILMMEIYPLLGMVVHDCNLSIGRHRQEDYYKCEASLI